MVDGYDCLYRLGNSLIRSITDKSLLCAFLVFRSLVLPIEHRGCLKVEKDKFVFIPDFFRLFFFIWFDERVFRANCWNHIFVFFAMISLDFGFWVYIFA